MNNLPLGSYYLKETVAGDHFVLNPEQKEFTLTAKDDTQAVVYEGVAYKTFMPRILGTTINETYMGHDWVFSCLP